MPKRVNVPDALFPTNNAYGIPVLPLERAARFVHAPPRAWGSVARTARHRGMWHHYVDDSRFEALWHDPSRLAISKAPATVEVNYSLGDDTPLAYVLWATYRKRWLAYYWTTLGFDVFVDLFVPRVHAETNLIGVPASWPAYATRATDRDIAELEYLAELALERAGDAKLLLMVYGGGGKTVALCHERGWIHVTDRVP